MPAERAKVRQDAFIKVASRGDVTVSVNGKGTVIYGKANGKNSYAEGHLQLKAGDVIGVTQLNGRPVENMAPAFIADVSFDSNKFPSAPDLWTCGTHNSVVPGWNLPNFKFQDLWQRPTSGGSHIFSDSAGDQSQIGWADSRIPGTA